MREVDLTVLVALSPRVSVNQGLVHVCVIQIWDTANNETYTYVTPNDLFVTIFLLFSEAENTFSL